MRVITLFVSSFLLLVLIIATAAGFCAAQSSTTKLDQYVSAPPDDVFGWTKVGSTVKNSTQYNLDFFDFTSQRWLTPENSDKAVWRHQLVVIDPIGRDPNCDTAFLWITWGSDKSNTTVPPWKPKGQNDMDLLIAADAAINSKCFAVMLYQVPQEPICWNLPQGGTYCASEDDAIGYSFEQYFQQNKSIEHTLLFPMTLAGIRAMDGSEQIFEQIYNHPIKSWVVSGASKRGWTTWLVGATDPKRYSRIKAIVPVVLDAIHFESFLTRQFHSYNQAFSWVVKPYRVLAANVNTSKWQEWAENIDPYYYRHRLTMPKFEVGGAGDEFQLLDDQSTWSHHMPGEMKTLIVYDADHALVPNLVTPLEAMAGFIQSIHLNTARPNYDWSVDQATGQITVTTSTPPREVKVWYKNAPNTGRRDFRNTVLSNPPCLVHVFGGCLRLLLWESATASSPILIVNSPTSFTTNVTIPTDGTYTGVFIELKFEQLSATGQKLNDFIFASPASVLPYGQYPSYEMCKGDACLNATLV